MIGRLKDINDANISSMGASWVSGKIEMKANTKLNVHLLWDNIAPQGDLSLEYSNKPEADPTVATDWEIKNSITLDGSFQSQMFIDSNLSLGWFIIRYVRTSGSAAVEGFVKVMP